MSFEIFGASRGLLHISITALDFIFLGCIYFRNSVLNNLRYWKPFTQGAYTDLPVLTCFYLLLRETNSLSFFSFFLSQLYIF